MAVLLAGTVLADAGDFTIVKNGRPCAAFAVPYGLSAAEARRVADDLALFNGHLREVTGTPLATNGAAAVRIEIALNPVTNLLTRADWRIVSPDARTLRVEATATSLFTALRQLLEEGCDARFLGVERCMFQFEPRPTVTVSRQERRASARSFTLQRRVYFLPGHARELGLDSDGAFRYSHAIPRYAFPGDKYNREGWPEAVMPTMKGRKLKQPKHLYDRWQPCYSNPEAAAIAVTNICAHLARHPEDLSVSLGINDNGGWCECESCRTMDADGEKSIFSNDRANRSASYYTFVKRVTDGVLARHPDLRFGLLAYMATIMPPPFEVSQSVIPVMTMDSFAATLDPVVDVRQRDVIARWGRKVRETGVWDYTWGRTSYILPRVDFTAQAVRIKYLHENGCRAYFGENGTVDVLDGPKLYLTARLLENVDADPEEILNEWYVRFAGPAAADELRGVYDACTAYWKTGRMKRTPYYVGRTWIYMHGGTQCLQAMEPGFTAGLVARLRKVRALAATDGEKRRAELLLRHFELLDCLVTFGGFAFVDAASGEMPSAKAAVAAIEDFRTRTPELFAEWKSAQSYFQSADFPDPKTYVWRDVIETNLVTALSGIFGRICGFREDAAVKKALARLMETPGLPEDAVRLCRTVSGDEGEIIRAEELPNGGKGPFRLIRDLEPGAWLVSAKVRARVPGAKAELIAWRQAKGKEADWATASYTSLKPGVWRTLVKVNSVSLCDDGLILSVRESGLAPDEHVEISELRLVKIADDPAASGVTTPAARLKADRRDLVTLGGEEAVVCSGARYDFLKPVYQLPRLGADERIAFTVRARRPEGMSVGKIGALLYRNVNGSWQQFHSLFWNRELSDRYEDITGCVDASVLDGAGGKVMVIVFKMKDTEGAAVSQVSWKRMKKKDK